MIVYFANRFMEIQGHATTNLLQGYVITEDLKTEEVETGVATFSCKIGFDEANRQTLEAMTEAGNYLLRSNDNENEFYTIIETEIDTRNQEIYVYAEDAGLDLINEIAGEFEATASNNAEWYINKYIADSGFVIGINEIPSNSVRKLSWDGESSVTERLASIADAFGGYEISYSFDIKGLIITNKYVNIHKERGKDVGEHLRLNRDIDRIVTTKSVANLATAFVCEGGTPENAENPITLKGYKYDDGDFFVEGDKLKSRKANAKWSRYVWNNEPNKLADNSGYIVKPYSYDTTDQATLCSHAITELKKVCDMAVNYEIDIKKLPDNVKIGDRINIVDDAGELYVSTRVLKLDTSVVDQKYTATLGEHLIKTSGISQKVIELAEQFAKNAQSAARAMAAANTAKTTAEEARTKADTAVADVGKAQQAANEATAAANTATQSAEQAQTAAQNAQNAVQGVEESVASLETTITEAQTAAANAQQAATVAQTKANEAATASAQAKADAADAKAAVGVAESKADTAITKAEAAQSSAAEAKSNATTAKETADAAKLDAEKAERDIASLGERLTTVTNTMEADYARKTDLTESEAHLQSQISQNAGLISSTVTMLSVIDETANDAQNQAEKALKRAQAARQQATQATADADAAQNAADEAQAAADSAQTEADTAREAANVAQAVVDKAEEDLAKAKANLETVLSRADATEAEISAAQEAVNTAQAAANKAKADADVAAQTAAEAQNSANTAINSAIEAQAAAITAASYAKIAQSLASEAENASAAQNTADEAAQTATTAKATADTAKTNAESAQAQADAAALAASNAQKAANDADAKVAQAASDLATAQQNLADVTSRVGATEEEVATAQQALELAQAAADKAKQDAAAAQSTADTAKANAATAQTVANNAKTAADNAQKAAEDAQAVADEAKAAAESLAVRVTTAETKITQNTEQIALRATKTEVADYINNIEIGGRNLLRNSSFEDNADEWQNSNFGDITKTATAGRVLTIGDHSDKQHDVEVKLTSKNLINLEGREVVDFGGWENTSKRQYQGGKGIIVGLASNNYYAGDKNPVYSVGNNQMSYVLAQANYGLGIDIKLKPNTKYALSCTAVSGYGITLLQYDADGNFLGTPTKSNNILTTNSNADWGLIYVTYNQAGTTVSLTEPQFEFGEIKTPYTPYIEDFSAIPVPAPNLVASGFTDSDFNYAYSQSFYLENGKTYKCEITTVDGSVPSVVINGAGWKNDSSPGYVFDGSFEFTHEHSSGDGWAMFVFGNASNIASVSFVDVNGATTKPATISVGGANLFNIDAMLEKFANKEGKTINGYYTISLQYKPNTQYYMKCNGVRAGDVFLVSTKETVNSDNTSAIGVSNTWSVEKCVTTDATGLIYFGGVGAEWRTQESFRTQFEAAMLQIEYGATASPYEPFVDPVEYTSNADGTVERVQSISPTMVITTDATITATYITHHAFVEKYGKQCGHIYHNALEQTKYVNQSVLEELEPNATYTLSGWVLTENIVKGNTNSALMFYIDGQYDLDGTATWFGYGSKDFPVNEGGGEWQHIAWTFTTDDKLTTATRLNAFVYTRDMTGDVYFYNLKLEKGNKVTDWTPAPEDVDSAIVESSNQIRQTITDESAAVVTTCEGVILEALKEYTQTGDFEEFKKTTEAQLKLLSDQMVLKFTQTAERLESINGDLQKQLNTITKYFVFDIDGMTIGQVDNPKKISIDNDEIQIIVNGNPVQSFDAEGNANIPALNVSRAFNLLGLLIDATTDESGKITNINAEFMGG